jgi:hypothetical protein
MRKAFTLLCVVSVLLVSLCFINNANAAQVENGDFTRSLEGWNTQGNVIHIPIDITPDPYAEVYIGQNYQTGSISQQIQDTTAGDHYILSFQVARLGSADTFSVTFGNTTTPLHQTDGNWQSFSLPVTTINDSTLLKFDFWNSVGGGGTTFYGLDHVSLTSAPVPVPPSLFLLAPGLLGLAAMRRRFTK